MALSRAASFVGLVVTREKLLERAAELEFALGATPAHESLADEGPYGGASSLPRRHIKDSVYWWPRLRALLREIEATDPAGEEGEREEDDDDEERADDTDLDAGYARRRSSLAGGGGGGGGAAAPPPTTTTTTTPPATTTTPTAPRRFRPTTLRARDLPAGGRDAQGGDLTATRAGYALAQFLRALGPGPRRSYRAVWVRPRLEPILPHDALSLWESSLLKLVASAVGALCHLAPRRGAGGLLGAAAAAPLSRANFAVLAAGRPGSIEAGLAALERLADGPPLDLDGRRRLVFIVDELDAAEHRGTVVRLTRFVRALVRLCARNNAPLIFTLKKQSAVLQAEEIM